MIIMDLSQVMISNLMIQLGNHTNAEIEEDLLRHMILNSVRAYNVKFKHEFGEMIIACDAGNNWRKQIFPYYKANRRKNREKSEINWTAVFETLNKVRDELKDYFPYRVIRVDGAEADDEGQDVEVADPGGGPADRLPCFLGVGHGEETHQDVRQPGGAEHQRHADRDG